MLEFFQHSSSLSEQSCPKWKLWTQLHLGCQTPGESGTLRRVIFKGQSQATVTLCGDYHRHPGKRGVIAHKCLYSHRFVFGLRMLCSNCFSQKWQVSGYQQSYSGKPCSGRVSFLTPPWRCSPVAHSHHPVLLVFPQVHLSQHCQVSSVRGF